MHLSPNVLAGLALRAGWRKAELADAIGVALAFSDGNTHARVILGHPPISAQHGLWGVDVVEHPELGDVDLYDPRANAVAAYGLYVAAGRSFSWSPVWRAGVSPLVASVAARAATAPLTAQPVESALSAGTLRAHAIEGVRVSQVVHAYRDRLRGGGG